MAIEVDVAILGGGPGGYTAAIRAAQEGKRVAIVEMDKLGGTCLHRGCIPSKAMLRSAEVYAGLLEAEQFGVKVDGSVALDFRRVLARREETVRQLHNGLQHLMKKHGIQMIYGKGRVIGPSIFRRAAARSQSKWRTERRNPLSPPILLLRRVRVRVSCPVWKRTANAF
ncbi:hypothetical protein PACILC2_52800 [Paenibacillus cisolokensis]|uniref:FAD/NAD(P)-binding domain-containing protein n=1 Tax=Paenibacillus cisolokensis TaxID=1658519 RepID=A0ABQ4NEV2_9BACL|nr:hypothetical protein PACILC2_52800 [Paenibacillus cisolokensis]